MYVYDKYGTTYDIKSYVPHWARKCYSSKQIIGTICNDNCTHMKNIVCVDHDAPMCDYLIYYRNSVVQSECYKPLTLVDEKFANILHKGNSVIWNVDDYNSYVYIAYLSNIFLVFIVIFCILNFTKWIYRQSGTNQFYTTHYQAFDTHSCIENNIPTKITYDISEVANNDDHTDYKSCAICLEDYKNEEALGELDCKHRFHFTCVKQWLEKNNRCPLCNTENI